MSNPPENLPLSPFKEHKSQIPCQSNTNQNFKIKSKFMVQKKKQPLRMDNCKTKFNGIEIKIKSRWLDCQ